MSTLTLDLHNQVQKAISRLENFYQCDLPSQELTSKLLSELNSALHELQTTTVELLQQNEEMELNRLKLEEERSRYHELFDFAPDGYLVTDTEGIILEANKAAIDLFNVNRSSLIGKPLAIFVFKEERLSFRTQLAEIKREDEVHKGNWELVMQSGKRPSFPVSITMGKILVSRGKTVELRWLLRDITKRRQMEEELQKAAKLESLGVLAGGIAHDLNNHLTVIIGNLTLAKNHTKENYKVNKYLQEMEEGLKQTGYLTRQLLTFAKGGNPLTKAVSICELAREVSAFALSGSKSSCELMFTEDLPPVEIDEGQITQVITNLLINADQAMQEGGTIKITGEEVVVNESSTLPLKVGNYVALTITDQGSGISDRILSRIFDPYFSTKEDGSGLGLTICYSIVKKHGGHISVQSEHGKGTSFAVFLPVSSVKIEKEILKENLIFGEGKVLLMEDQESVRQTASEMMTFLGYEVESAKDGAEAIRLYKQAFLSDHPFDVVITDLTVRGGMGGKMAVGELIRIDPDVKAIVSSGYSSDDVLSDYKKHGFYDVIPKPYKLQELSKILNRVIRGSKQ